MIIGCNVVFSFEKFNILFDLSLEKQISGADLFLFRSDWAGNGGSFCLVGKIVIRVMLLAFLHSFARKCFRKGLEA